MKARRNFFPIREEDSLGPLETGGKIFVHPSNKVQVNLLVVLDLIDSLKTGIFFIDNIQIFLMFLFLSFLKIFIFIYLSVPGLRSVFYMGSFNFAVACGI